jgi:dienelactone hydrolase
MRRSGGWAVAALFSWLIATGAAAEEKVHFPSSADRGADAPATLLDGYLYRPAGDGAHPALVFMHGCGGLLNKQGRPWTREADWARRFNGMGYVVLMVDSFGPRGSGEMCSQAGFKIELYRARPHDAYGALAYLQQQPFVRPDRIGLVGWSQGGGATLIAIRDRSASRPASLPKGDFRVALAFYPAACRANAYSEPWTTRIPLQVLIGENDVWTPAAPCRQMIEQAAGDGAPVAIKVYGGAYHDFDWPDAPVHELPQYVTRTHVVPIAGMDPAARDDALALVPAFLAKYLDD